MKYGAILATLLLVLAIQNLNAQASLSVALYPDTILCNGQSNGTITFNILGGTPPYHYEWKKVNNNFVFEQGDVNLAGETQLLGGDLPANGYIIEVTDADGFSLIDTAFILTPYPIYISETVIENPSCSGICDASIALSVGGGTGDISVTWADIDDVIAARTQLCEGAYSFFLIDENGCSQKGLIDIIDPSPLSVVAVVEAPSCAGLSNGQISLIPDGGALPYTFQWEDDSNADNLNELVAGMYDVTIEDAHQCPLEASFTVAEGLGIISNVQVNYGCGDGQVLVTTYPINGQGPFETSWSTGLSGDVLYGVSAGDFSLTLTDVNGCVQTSAFVVDFVPTLELSGQISPVSCPESQDGGVNVIVSGGLQPFAFSWSNGSEDQDLEMVSGGDYTLNVLGEGCAMSQSFSVPEPFPIQVNFIFNEETTALLSATAFVNGGTPPYSLQWSNGDSGFMANNLEPAISYTLTITDQNNCTASFEFDALLTHSETIVETSNILFYPNPVNDWLYIELLNDFSATSFIQIYDMKGSKIVEKNWAIGEERKINLSELVVGVYAARFYNGEYVEFFKIIKGR